MIPVGSCVATGRDRPPPGAPVRSLAPLVPPPPPSKYAPLADAARFAGLSVKTLERRIQARQLDVFRVGTRRLVELSAVDRLVRSGRVAVPLG